MARDGSGNYTLPANTQAVSGDPISSTKFNTLVQDLEADANTDRPIVAGGTGASTALAARANLGLEIGVNVQAYDAGLLSIAGLTTLADRSIYTTASDTYAVYTLTAAGRAILDDADAAAQRTTLGLGTAALKNTGTSGDAVPLLDAANTFSAAQTFASDSGVRGDDRLFTFQNAAGTRRGFFRFEESNLGIQLVNEGSGGQINFATTGGGVVRINSNTVWHAGNDGAGSGLDADTVDGAHVGTSGATIPLLNAGNTFSGAQTFTSDANALAGGTGTFPGFQLKNTTDSHLSLNFGFDTSNRRMFWNRWNTSTGAFIENLLYIQQDGIIDFVGATTPRIGGNAIWHAGNDGAGSGLDADTLDGVQGSAYAALASPALTGTPTIDGAAAVSVSATQTLTNKTLTTPTINGGTIQSRPQAASETTGTLTVASANKTIQATGDITIPNAVFAAGDIILIYAGASSRTITEGASVTMRLGGSSTTGSRTLAARGVAVLFFVSSSEVVVSGGAVT